MIIDIAFIILVIMALVKGYTKGFIIAIFSLLAIIVGLTAAIKLSAVTANWLKDTVNVGAKWLPILAFAVVFIIVVILVRLGAMALQKTAELVMLGWLNKLCGILLYFVLYTIILSVVLFYAEKINFLQPSVIASSKTYNFIKPWGPKAIDAIGSFIPLFKDMFQQLEDFFAHVAEKAS